MVFCGEDTRLILSRRMLCKRLPSSSATRGTDNPLKVVALPLPLSIATNSSSLTMAQASTSSDGAHDTQMPDMTRILDGLFLGKYVFSAEATFIEVKWTERFL